MHCRVLKTDKEVMAVQYTDEHGYLQACIVPRTSQYDRVGQNVDLPDELLAGSLEYGVDLCILFDSGDLCIDLRDIQQALRNHGLWTVYDCKRNHAAVVNASRSIISHLARQIISNMDVEGD